MNRSALSVVVIGFFTLILVGNEPSKSDTSTSSSASSSPSSASAAPSVSVSATPIASANIPAVTGWSDDTIKAAKVLLKIPKGAKAPADRAGNDAQMGAFFTIVMPSGYGVYAKAAQKPDTVAGTKTFYTSHARGEIHVIYDAPDAIIANRTEAGPAGSYCEVTACSAPAHGKPMCVEMAGAIVGSTVQKLTADECADVVAMMRSVKAAP